MTLQEMESQSKLSLGKLVPGDLDELVRLYEIYLNYGDGVRPHFISALNDPSTIGYKCSDGDKIAGFTIYVKGISLSGEHPEIMADLERRTAGRVVYTGDAAICTEEYRSHGVSKLIYKACYDELVRRGIQCTINELWIYPDGHIPAKGILKNSSNVTLVGRYEKFYKDFHLQGYYCPICGKDCLCGAEIYIADIP